jgi:DNA-binding NarL/FixJ family response regulator
MNKIYRAVLADDERLMREQMRARLAEVWPELELVAEAKNGLEAVQAVQQHAPDIVFLDIRMPGLTGVGLANIRERLQLLYGNRATLNVRENPGGGTAVTVTVPYKSIEGASA